MVATSPGGWTAPSLVVGSAAAKQQPINNKDDTITPKTATATTSAVVDTQVILTNDGILKNTSQKEPVPSVVDESFPSEDAIRDEKLVGRILSRKTAKKTNSHNNNHNGTMMMDGIVGTKPIMFVETTFVETEPFACDVVCHSYLQGTQGMECFREAEDCASIKEDAATVDLKTAVAALEAAQAAVVVASTEVDKARLVAKNAADAAANAATTADNTAFIAKAAADNDGTEQAKQAAVIAQQAADAALIAYYTASSIAGATEAEASNAADAVATATAAAKAAAVAVVNKESEVLLAAVALTTATDAKKWYKKWHPYSF